MINKILRYASIYALAQENCCELRAPGTPLGLGCSQMSPDRAKSKAQEYYKVLSESASFLEKYWDSSSNPPLHAMELISKGKPCNMDIRQQAVNYLPANIDKCDFINVLNGWPNE